MKACAYAIASALSGLVLASCAVVDQFGGRVYDSNLNSQYAMNQETLINIIRASKYQAMNFVAVTQVTGGQTETLSTGLPTITFGPKQTVAQHQFPISNSLSSGFSGGFTFSPLVSTQFQTGMLSPVSARTTAILASSHPREPILYLLIDAITLTDKNFSVRFTNDPARRMAPAACDAVATVKNPTKRQLLQFETDCNYRAFVRMLETLIDAGLTAELIPSNPGSKDAPPAPGHVCFERSRALEGWDASPQCGVPAPPGKKANSVKLGLNRVGWFDLSLSFRSPVAVYRFVGQLYGQHNGGDFRYRTGQVQNLLAPAEPYINITNDPSLNCYAGILYEGQHYCVPFNSPNTALVFTVLQELRNLSIQSTDLNSAINVRVTN